MAALACGIAYLAAAIGFARQPGRDAARALFRTSLVYLPVLLTCLVADRLLLGGLA